MSTHPTTKSRRRKAFDLAAQADASDQQADAYRKMLALATDLGLEHEMERMAEGVREYEDDAEDRRMQACDLGFDPDDEA